MTTTNDTLYLIDGSGFIFRAYYGIRTSMTAADGTPTNAVFGFTRLLLNVLRDRSPSHVAVVFDMKAPTFRHKMYPEYKANRKEPPDDLKPQFALCREMVTALGLPSLAMAGYEADDIIGTLARRWTADDRDCVIVTSDKDMMQLVDAHTTMWDGKEKISGHAEVVEKFGVEPSRVIYALGLAGDSSDNIPGVPGVGPKTATTLLQKYPDVEALLADAHNIKGKRGENLVNFADQARLSVKLATIALDVPIKVDMASLALTEPDPTVLTPFLLQLNFNRFLKEFGLTAPEPMPMSTPTPMAPTMGQLDLLGGAPATTAATTAAAVDRAGYRAVTTEANLAELVTTIRDAGRLSIDLETTSLSIIDAQIVGFALSWAPRQAAYVPVAHEGDETQLSLTTALKHLQPLIEDTTLPKFGQNLKYDWQVLHGAGVALNGIAGDSMLAAYLLYPNRRTYGLDALAKDLLNHEMITFNEVTNTKKGTKKAKEARFALVSIQDATAYACEDADVALRLCDLLLPALASAGLTSINQTLELPLIKVLARMELRGIKLDGALLKAQSAVMAERIDALATEIYEAAGETFNIDSPKQLSELLFDRLELPRGKKTKGRTAASTDREVLRKLTPKHPVPGLVLRYRHLKKLRGTYLEPLPSMVNPRTGRLHSAFRQAAAATGRLSSSDPNLQNIPIRSREGREIRAAFITEPGWKLLSADYSQVELRLLAHYSEDPGLLGCFADGVDIHTRTASEVFNLPEGLVTPELRARAKAVNFGLMYGMGAHGLSQDLDISRKEAQHIIDLYFTRFGGVERYRDQAIERARRTGMSKTLLGRTRPLPEITTRSFQGRKAAERLAVNTPIQGTAADILKRAMINLDARLQREGLEARILLTVHDELVLEVPEAELDRVPEMVRQEMEGACALRVPLKVEMSHGDSWADIH